MLPRLPRANLPEQSFACGRLHSGVHLLPGVPGYCVPAHKDNPAYSAINLAVAHAYPIRMSMVWTEMAYVWAIICLWQTLHPETAGALRYTEP